MTLEWRWLDEDLRILKVRLFSFDSDTVGDLETQLLPIAQEPYPLFVLMNLGDLELGDLMQHTSPNDISLPNMEHHEQHSSLAIVTARSGIRMLLDMANQLTGRENAIRAFQHEDEALSWLQTRAQNANDEQL